MPYKLGRNKNSGGVTIYVRENILKKVLTKDLFLNNMKDIFVEINFRKSKWLFSVTYPHPSQTDHIRSYFGPYFPAFGLNTERYGVFFAGNTGKFFTPCILITLTKH